MFEKTYWKAREESVKRIGCSTVDFSAGGVSKSTRERVAAPGDVSYASVKNFAKVPEARKRRTGFAAQAAAMKHNGS
jgi:hypothetical protein